MNRDLSGPAGEHDGRHPLPEPGRFCERLGAWGIDNGCEVVVYDDGPAASAARLWWMLRWVGHRRSRVLNGGLRTWTAAGLPLERTTPQWQPAAYAADAIQRDWVIGGRELAAWQAAGGVLIDARSPPRYRGEEEPIDAVAGHVPGALNRPFPENLEADGRFRDPASLRADYERLLAGRDAAQAAAMCGSGITACHLLLAMNVAGLGDGKLYAGSWSEWITDPGRPVATGPDP